MVAGAAGAEVVGADSGSGVLGGLPNPNPTGFPKLPLFAAPPKPPNGEVDLGGLEVPKKPPVLPVLEEVPNGFDELFPKRLFALELVSFSFSSEVDLPKGDADPPPNAPLGAELPNRDEVGLGSESPDSLGLGGEEEEGKSGTVAVEPNADLPGVVDAEPKENPELVLEGASLLSKPVVADDDGIVFPPKLKLVAGFGMAVEAEVDDPKPDPPDPLNRDEEGAGAGAEGGAGLLLGFSSNSFWTDILKFL